MLGEAKTAASGPPPVARLRHPEIDDVTLGRARRGEAAALGAVVKHYEHAVYALCGRILARRPDRIDDLAQESFIRVLRGLPRFDPVGPARLSTWILTIATRACLNDLRDTRSEDPLPETVADAGPRADPERSTAERQLGRRVEAAMALLLPDMRAVLVLRAYHDFDYPEIADALGLEIGTVKSRLARARVALREALAHEEIRP